MGPVGAAQPLDCAIGAPAWLEQEMHASALVGDIETGVIAAAGAAGVREDQDLLAPCHEGVGLGGVRARRAALDQLSAVAANRQTPAPAGDFGDRLLAKAGNDGIERTSDRRHGAELFDARIAAFERFGAVNRVPVNGLDALVLKTSRVAGAQRLELVGAPAERLSWYKQHGCYTEIIAYKTRLFVLEERAEALLEAIVAIMAGQLAAAA